MAKEVKDADEDMAQEPETTLPSLQEGDVLPNKGVDIKEDKTKPQPLLTDATLLAYMETAGKDVEDEEAREAMKVGGLGTPAIGNVKIGYAYQLYNFNEYLVQHEITIKIGFAKKKEID
ncbi:hypothetical protein FACS189456_2880 [Bacteroidia bacterium]|nr:hypothetical protein FACS189456_2880 [Bacteroidia bacterium]